MLGDLRGFRPYPRLSGGTWFVGRDPRITYFLPTPSSGGDNSAPDHCLLSHTGHASLRGLSCSTSRLPLGLYLLPALDVGYSPPPIPLPARVTSHPGPLLPHLRRGPLVLSSAARGGGPETPPGRRTARGWTIEETSGGRRGRDDVAGGLRVGRPRQRLLHAGARARARMLSHPEAQSEAPPRGGSGDPRFGPSQLPRHKHQDPGGGRVPVSLNDPKSPRSAGPAASENECRTRASAPPHRAPEPLRQTCLPSTDVSAPRRAHGPALGPMKFAQ